VGRGSVMENKKANFKRISESRVNKILNLFEQLTNLTNTSFYEYTEADIEKMFDIINEESEKTRRILLRSNNDKKKRFEL